MACDTRLGFFTSRLEKDGDLKSVKPGCECLIFTAKFAHISSYFNVSVYLGVAIIVISWE